jgi:hypothetical protein
MLSFWVVLAASSTTFGRPALDPQYIRCQAKEGFASFTAVLDHSGYV